MVHEVLSGNRRQEALRLGNVTDNQPRRGRSQRLDPRGLADQTSDFVALAGQRRHQVGADEPTCAGYQNFSHDMGYPCHAYVRRSA